MREYRTRQVQLPFFSAWVSPDGGWFRVFGYGLSWKNFARYGLTFSERNGYRKFVTFMGWTFTALGRMPK